LTFVAGCVTPKVMHSELEQAEWARPLERAALVIPIALGLAGSAALVVDYVRSAPVFCAEGGGCEAVKHTALASAFGVPTPVFGLLGFGVLGLLSLFSGRAARLLYCAVALFGAAVGGGLIAAQFAIGEYCIYCMTVDCSACLVAGVAVWRAFGKWDLGGGYAFRGAVAALEVAAAAAVIAFGSTARVRLPPSIAEEIQKAPRGRATVVEFVDFECPFCREEYSDLAPMLEAQKEKLHIVRKLVPLTKIHPHAMDAARAACCAELLGKGDAMADALFRAPVEELTSSGCERIASELGLDLTQYGACVSDPKTTERIALDRQVFDRSAAKGDGLPLLWIGQRKIMGAQGADALRRALGEAIATAGS
jgi:protein-disulfide isomerase/uncharacterized membrane protein